MTLDLSVLAKPETVDPFYEIHWKDMKALARHQRDAHFYSMLHSQKADYGAELRFVMTEADLDELTGFKVPNVLAVAKLSQVILQTCAEIVVRLPAGDYLLKAKDGEIDTLRPRGPVQQVATPGSAPSSTHATGKKRPLEL